MRASSSLISLILAFIISPKPALLAGQVWAQRFQMPGEHQQVLAHDPYIGPDSAVRLDPAHGLERAEVIGEQDRICGQLSERGVTQFCQAVQV